MRILVTGGAGFIGSNVVDRFVELGHEVAMFDDLSSGRREFVTPRRALVRRRSGRRRGRRALHRGVPPRDRGSPCGADRRAASRSTIRCSTRASTYSEPIGCCRLHATRRERSSSTRRPAARSTARGGTLPATEDHPVNPEVALRREQAHGRALPLYLEAPARTRLHRAALSKRVWPAPEPAWRGRRERHLHRPDARGQASAHLRRRRRRCATTCSSPTWSKATCWRWR